MLIETKGYNNWMTQLASNYNLDYVRINESETSITVFLDNSVTGENSNILIGKFNMQSDKGVIYDRRSSCR